MATHATTGRYGSLIERARRSEPILIDGGTGSECVRRGVDLLSLEMMVDLPRMTATLDAVSQVELPIRERWDGPLGAYAHATRLVDGEYVFENAVTPEEYAAYEPAWRAAGATMLGGCCGIGPDHISSLRHAMELHS